MFNVTITEKGGSQTAHDFDKTEVTIGRVKGNDIVLPKGNVSKRHSRIVVKDGKFIIVDLKSTNGTYVNGRKISAPHVIKDTDKVYIGDFILTVKEDDGSGVASGGPSPAASHEAIPSFPSAPAAATIPSPAPLPSSSPLSTTPGGPAPFGRPSAPSPVTGFGPPKGAGPGGPSLPPSMQPNQIGGPSGAPLPGLGRGPGALGGPAVSGPGPLGAAPSVAPPSPFGPPGPSVPPGVSGGFSASKPNLPPAPMVPPAASGPFPAAANQSFAPPAAAAPAAAPSTPSLRVVEPEPRAPSAPPTARASLPPKPSLNPGHDEQARAYNEFSMIVMEAFLDHFDPRELPEAYPADPEVKDNIRQALVQAYDTVSAELPPNIDREALLESLLNEAVGLGPLEYYLDDESITDIHVNGPSRLVLERQGQLLLADRTFTNADFLYLAALRLLSIQGLGAQPPLLNEVRFSDGTLVQVILPPVAVGAPVITIRKPRRHFINLSHMVERATLSPAMASFLQLCIDARRNILVCGPRGAGRTSLVNALLDLVPDGARIVAVESTSMLQLPQRTAVTLEAQSASAFADGVDLDALVQHAQRLRPDRLVVDEISGREALGFLLAAAGGAAGSVGVITALSAQDALRRIEQLSLLAGPTFNASALLQQIARSIDIVICVHRYADGTRRIVEIAEVTPTPAGPVCEPIFQFQQDGMGQAASGSGRFTANHHTPRFYQELINGGAQLPTDIFRS